MPKTLYATDLDGTLLRDDTTLSAFAIQTINGFLARGGLFTYASARSHVSASRLTAQLRLTLPAVIYNGTFLVEPDSGAHLWACYLPTDVVRRVMALYAAHGIPTVVYATLDGRERASWVEGFTNPGLDNYIRERPGDTRNRPVADPARQLDGDIFYMMTVLTRAAIDDLAPRVAQIPGLRVHTLENVYHPGEFWLEVTAPQAGKDHALRRLKEMTGADRLVCFGDNFNDLPMFEAADEAYAVANAQEAVKAAATGVIGANMADGVARFLAEAMP